MELTPGKCGLNSPHLGIFRETARVWPLELIVSTLMGRISGYEYEQLAKRLAERDRNVTPKLGSKRTSWNRAEIVQLQEQLIRWANS